MKTKLILKITSLLFLMTSIFVLYSCSKNADKSLNQTQTDQRDSNTLVTVIDQKDINESDEDLSTVDYKEFYDQLAPYGEWVEVNAEEIGMKPNTASLKRTENERFTISNILGIKSAYADASVGTVFVWSPSPEFAVVNTIEGTPQYTPYNNGQWVNTSAGWYFKAPTPWEETVHHYGRWVRSPQKGWMWAPGRVWAPAWVDWRQDDQYVSWAPLRPSVYYSAGNFSTSAIDDNDYYIVERQHFIDPDIYRYSSPYYDNGNRISMNLMTGTVGLVVVDNMIINRGPDVNVIQTYYPNSINVVNINHVRNFNEVRYANGEFYVYTPDFKRYTNKGHPEYRRNVPKSFKQYAEMKNNSKEYKKDDKEFKNDNKGNDNGNKNGPKEINRKNSGNENVKQNNSLNKEKHNKSSENIKQNKGSNKEKHNKNNENIKQNKSNNNEKQNKGNENVKQNKGSNNEKQSKGNENVKQNKGSNNEKQNKGNENVKQNKGSNNEKQNKNNK